MSALGCCVWAAIALACSGATAAASVGSTVVVGGALRDDNHAVWQRIVQLAGGRGARIAVLATASAEPAATAAAIVANLRLHGAAAEVIPVAPLIAGIDLAAAVRSPRWLARLGQAGGVFFSGGAQARLVDTLQPGGVPTPLLQAIRAVHARGGVIAGTSSGAAVLSAVMFRDAPDVLAALRQPLRDGIEVDRGFGLLPDAVVVDQHFIRRGRIARLLPLMASRGIALGLGVEEDSAAVVQGLRVHVIGSRGVLVVDLADAQRDPALDAFNLHGVLLHWLVPGDRYDLGTRQAYSAKAERQRLSPPLPSPSPPPPPPPRTADAVDNTGSTRADGAVAFHADMLAAGTLVSAMQALLERRQRQALGLSFTPGVALAFEWRLYQDDGTRGWAGARAEDTTVTGLRLDLRPVRMALPLYVPMAPAQPLPLQPPMPLPLPLPQSQSQPQPQPP